MNTPLLSTSSAVELSTAPFEDLAPRDGDVTWHDDSPVLVGCVCTNCDAKNFPARMACYNCGGVDLAAVEMASRGTLYSHTTVHVSSSRETPYHLAYIDLDDGVRILANVSPEAVEAGIDQSVEISAVRGESWWFTASTGKGAAA